MTIQKLVALMLVAKGLPTTTGIQIFHETNELLVQVHSVNEVFLAEEVATEVKAKYGWEMWVKF